MPDGTGGTGEKMATLSGWLTMQAVGGGSRCGTQRLAHDTGRRVAVKWRSRGGSSTPFHNYGDVCRWAAARLSTPRRYRPVWEPG